MESSVSKAYGGHGRSVRSIAQCFERRQTKIGTREILSQFPYAGSLRGCKEMISNCVEPVSRYAPLRKHSFNERFSERKLPSVLLTRREKAAKRTLFTVGSGTTESSVSFHCHFTLRSPFPRSPTSESFTGFNGVMYLCACPFLF